MRSIPIILSPLLLYLTVNALPDQSPLLSEVSNGPSIYYARENAPHVFNAIHSSMRQWGSSLNHNGMSFFLATVPKGTSFYHGTSTSEPVKGMEWLAFEIEHAEVFAAPRRGPPHGKKPGDGPGRGGPGGHPPGDGPHLRNDAHSSFKDKEDPSYNFAEGDEDRGNGYVHHYRTSRPLTKLLYIDGMSAGKTSMGTLDSTDYIVRNLSRASTAPNNDWIRAAELCEIGKQWGIEGFLRMEAGFEIILCNFTEGLDFVSATQRPHPYHERNNIGRFEYVRAVGYRYQGITGGRVEVDYSSMVSAFFYPVNLTNPDATRSELPRAIDSSDTEQLLRIRSDVLSLFQSEGDNEKIDWQGVVDMIVTRYSDRLKFMIEDGVDESAILLDIKVLLNIFTDYSNIDIPSSIERCANHYLDPVEPKTNADHLIHASVLTVSHRICSTLYEVRELLEGNEEKEAKREKKAKGIIKELIDYLNWSTWLECGKCAYDEVCYVAIWPWGSPEDHYSPSCIKREDVGDRRGYWDFGG